MSAIDIRPHWREWAQSIAEKTDVSTIVFLQLGSNYLASVDLLSEVGFSLQSVESFLDDDEVEGNRIVLTGLDDLATASGEQRLGMLRIKVLEQVRGGRRFVLQSRAPRIVYESRGSLLVMDATFMTGPPKSSWAEQASPSLIFEAELDPARPFRSVLRDTLSELGLSLCARLDRVIYESGNPDLNAHNLDGSETEALRGAGLLNSSNRWEVPDPSALMRRELTDVLDGKRDATLHLTAVVEEFDALTSTLRKTLRAAARARWGPGWAVECIPHDFAENIIKRASSDLMPLAESIEDVRDALLWLNVRELLRLRRDCSFGKLGMGEAAWKMAERELGAVEDRLRFFGHLTRQDEECVRKWSGLFADKLSHTGHLDRTHSSPALAQREAELLDRIRDDLAVNPAFGTPAGAAFLDLVTTTLRFLKRTSDTSAKYTRPFPAGKAPKEAALQEHFYWYLGSTGIGDTSYTEVPNMATGRVDVLVLGDNGTRFVTEVKRELSDASMTSLASSYFGQASDYQVNNEPLGQLLVLDLTSHTNGVPSVKDSVHVETRDVGGTLRSIVIYVVRGNRPPPSAIRASKA